MSRYRSPIVTKKIANDPPRYELRKLKKSKVNTKKQGVMTNKQQQLLQQAAAKLKRKYDEQQKEFNKKFNTKYKPIIKHRYPTRQKTLCEEYTEHVNHKDINLTKNRLTNRRSALEGWLQHAYAVWDPEQQKMLEFKDLIKNPKTKQVWTTSLANELGRLSQGIRDIKGSNCIKFIHKHQVPKGKMSLMPD